VERTKEINTALGSALTMGYADPHDEPTSTKGVSRLEHEEQCCQEQLQGNTAQTGKEQPLNEGEAGRLEGGSDQPSTQPVEAAGWLGWWRYREHRTNPLRYMVMTS